MYNNKDKVKRRNHYVLEVKQGLGIIQVLKLCELRWSLTISLAL
jgi:hypothetical protein